MRLLILHGLLALSTLLAAAPAALAQQGPSIKARVNTRTLAYGQVLRLQVTVNEAGQAGGDLEPPPLGQWTVVSQSRQMRFDGIRGQSQTVLSLGLRPEGVGVLTIGAFTLRTNGQVLKTEPVTVNVTGQGPKPPPASGAVKLQGGDGDSPDEMVFLRWEVDSQTPWLGQQINASLYIYVNRRLSVGGVSAGDINLEGFWNQPVDDRRERARVVTVEGRSYVRERITRYVLFPIRSGALSLPAVEVQMDARAGFGRRQMIKRTTPPLKLEVKPLPSRGRPEGFAGPAVGRLSLQAVVDRKSIKAEQGAQLTITTRVRGLLQNVPEIELPELDDFQVFPPTRNKQTGLRGEQLQGVRTATWLLRPKRAGELVIPEITLPYFDPERVAYLTARTRPITLTVSGDVQPQAGGDVASTKALSEPAAGLRTIRKESSLGAEVSPAYASPLFLLIILLPPLALLGLVAQERLALKRGQGAGARSARQAAAVATAALGAINTSRGAEGFTGITKALIGFLEQRLGTTLQGLTRDQLASALGGHGISKGTVEELIAELENCDFARFAPSGSRADELQEALGRAQGLIDKVEREVGA